MPDLTFQEALNILHLIDSGAFLDLEIEFEGTKLKVARRAGPAEDPIPRVARPPEPPRTSVGAGHGFASKASDKRAPPPPSSPRPPLVEVLKRIDVKPPMAGTFYTAPAPGAVPFVEVDRPVKKGDQLGIVEVMKLFTPVLSPSDGTVRAILVGNEEFVQSDQTLMTIEAAEDKLGS